MGEEKIFEEKVKNWLISEGIYALGTPIQEITVRPCGYWEKRWGGGRYVKSGLPDMHIVVNGVSIEAELKSSTGTPSEMQKQKLRQIEGAGCIGFVLRPDDFERFKNLILVFKTLPNCYTDLVGAAGLVNGWNKTGKE